MAPMGYVFECFIIREQHCLRIKKRCGFVGGSGFVGGFEVSKAQLDPELLSACPWLWSSQLLLSTCPHAAMLSTVMMMDQTAETVSNPN